MRNLLLFLIIFSTLSCKAQIVDNLYISQSSYGTEGYYYKDLADDLGRFEGNWLYSNGNSSIQLNLVKKESLHIVGPYSNYYTDALVGGYRYVVNGNDIINTLSSTNQNLDNIYGYYIGGNSIARFGGNLCNGCTAPNQRKVFATFGQPNCDKGPPTNFNLRYFTEGSVEKIEVVFYKAGPILPNFDPNDTTPPDCTEYLVPYGTYVFIKQ